MMSVLTLLEKRTMTETYEKKIERLIRKYDPKTADGEWDSIHKDIDRKCAKFRHHFLGDRVEEND